MDQTCLNVESPVSVGGVVTHIKLSYKEMAWIVFG